MKYVVAETSKIVLAFKKFFIIKINTSYQGLELYYATEYSSIALLPDRESNPD